MTRLVAEIGSSHNGSLDRALALTEAAAAAGFSDVKTQVFRVEQLFATEALEVRPELRARAALEVPWEWHEPLRERCHALGMRYGITPCHLAAVPLCAALADWLKVGSYSLLDLPLLRAVGAAGSAVVVSTGMATLAEVHDAVEALGGATGLTLLHCVSAYPAPQHEANLRSIPYLRAEFGCAVGWSDHTRSRLVLRRAIEVYGAELVEVHFDLDDGQGSEAGHSWTPTAWKTRCEVDPGFGGYYACDGKSQRKAPTLSEESERDWRADPSDGLRPLRHVREALLAPR